MVALTDADGGHDGQNHDDPHDETPFLKDGSTRADNPSVYDGIGRRPRLTWSSVTDTGGTPRPTADRREPTDRSSFRFDLGGALARLGGDEPSDQERPVQEPAEPEPPTPASEPIAHPQPEPTPVAEAAAPVVVPLLRPLATPFTTPSTAPLTSGFAEPLIDLGRLDRGMTAPGEPTTQRATPTFEPPTFEPPVEARPAEPDYPRRVPGAHLDPWHRIAEPAAEPFVETVAEPFVEPTADADPESRGATPADAAPRRVAPPSVFGDIDQWDPSVRGQAGRASAPNLPGAPIGMPTLPASNPAAPPPMVGPVAGASSNPDINALRSAQLKASRQQRQGKLFGRSLMAFVVVGGLIAAAMVFGRSLLFDSDWDVRLTPIVNEVEAGRGAPFESTVPLTTLGPAEFGDRLRTATIGAGWVDRVPEWRALNLTVGTVTAESVADEMGREQPAFYDARADEILLVEGSDDASDDLRLALEDAYDAQQSATAGRVLGLVQNGFVGVSTPQVIAERAVDNFLANRTAEREPANESLPIPVAYQLAAADILGEPILAAAGIDPASLTLGSVVPESIGEVLGDNPANTASGLLQPGDRSAVEPVALGTDDWSLVWSTRLPETTVSQLVDQVTADSYRPVERAGNTCVIGVFETATDDDGNAVFAAMLTWAAAAPPASQAVATQPGPTRVQIEACDPGVDNGLAGNPGVVDALIDRQQRRLTN